MTITATYPSKEKKYKCKECGYIKLIKTNHYKDCWSFGKFNTCPECPLCPECGGRTIWNCLEKEPIK